MEISEKMPQTTKYSSLEGKEKNLRFELFDWLKSKNISAQQALDLLSLTREAVSDAYRAESRKIML